MKTRKWIALALLATGVGMQFIRGEKTNPPTDPTQTVFAKTAVPDDVTAILKRACWDCHSNETEWHWYANVAPIMWSVRGHVKSGRAHLNFSEWGKYSPDEANEIIEELCEVVQDRSMPMRSYLVTHRDARLSDADIAALCRWAGSLSSDGNAAGSVDGSEEHEGE